MDRRLSDGDAGEKGAQGGVDLLPVALDDTDRLLDRRRGAAQVAQIGLGELYPDHLPNPARVGAPGTPLQTAEIPYSPFR